MKYHRFCVYFHFISSYFFYKRKILPFSLLTYIETLSWQSMLLELCYSISDCISREKLISLSPSLSLAQSFFLSFSILSLQSQRVHNNITWILQYNKFLSELFRPGSHNLRAQSVCYFRWSFCMPHIIFFYHILCSFFFLFFVNVAPCCVQFYGNCFWTICKYNITTIFLCMLRSSG